MNFEIPSLQPKITKEFLLGKNSEETYMSTYLGIPIKKGLFISPIRSDKRPTASFYRNKSGELIFHDFGIGFHGNFVGVVMHLHNCSYQKAMRIIAEDFKYIDRDEIRPPIKIKISPIVIEEKPDTTIQVEIQPFTKSELSWWESFGIHESTLKRFRVYSCKSVFINGNYFKSSTPKSNIFGYYGGKKDGNELWRIYFPQNKNFRFLSNWSKSMIQGAKYLSSDLNDKLVITKSLKDVLSLYESHIPAIAPCSETIIITKRQMDRIHQLASNIIYIGDNDLPGVRGAHKYKKEYPFIRCVFIKRKYAKDISDLYKFCGIQDYNEAIQELNMIFNEETIRETKHFWIF